MLKTTSIIPKNLVLASNSTARKQLLAQTGLEFLVKPADIDERQIETSLVENGADLRTIAETLAAEKALSIGKTRSDDLIIGADQTLDFNGKPLHKPKDITEARHQLLALIGETHTLHSAVALICGPQIVWQYVADIHLTMRHVSVSEVDHLLTIEGEEILSCVGAYRLEGPMVRLFSNIEGDYFSILGLPLLQLMAGLRQIAPHFLEPRP